MDPDSLLTIASAGLGGLLGSMYLDSRLLLGRDFHQIRSGAAAQIYHRLWTWQDKLHLYYRFQAKAKAHPNRVFVVFEGKPYTYKQLEKDIVCMMHQNHPTFYITWLAILKIGATPALINTNLAEDSLLHCIKVADSSMLLFDPVYEKQVATISDKLAQNGVSLWAYGESTENNELPPLAIAPTLTPSVLAQHSDRDTDDALLKGIGNSDPAMLIYTSGTTGMPKAAVSQHARVDFGGLMYSGVTGLRADDRVYCVLPLYHSSGIIVTTAVALQAGATIVLGRKFSASRFWDDCTKYNVTAFTYIGEFCRYLLSQPPHPHERNHKVRLVYGNGMRPDVWNRFRDRFGIPEICEFYAATEAPTTLFNPNRGHFGSGSVGHRGYLFRAIRRELKLIKIDPISEEPVRGPDGFCVVSDYGEQGELLVRIDNADALGFDGYYKNEGATKKKILTNVLEKGDAYFRSGDLLQMDRDGFYFFGDRVGDTFRWKSENVATTEVAHAVGLYPVLAEANVYGTLVPHHDGRAGMAAVVVKEGETLDFKDFYAYLKRKLPKYAIPLFIRFVPSMELTGTFKQQKVQFRNQGIDLDKIDDPVFWLRGDTYVPFKREDYQSILDGKVSL
ncbi:probable fat1-long-chain fatty acid transporter [Lichtheimia corymbifera JMRC:FSU:9682]|uniref:Very long-chain fatty acid transport protein n=1 Tax=Lichtheimia corymbifera JMRC:FSU:9682 TaxID=1263082 RepID=A0A068RRD6_9FUNG|nr:probable fat1-long-chain fatty acid transporter [Lichtheimia corymbifera JMRC:FSU:9682]